MKGWMYILECCDGSYYTGSTNNLERRLQQHQNGEGANNTKKRLPVFLIYSEEFDRVQDAFYREKQVQGWSRKKKEALMTGDFGLLSHLARNYTQFPRVKESSSLVSTSSTCDGDSLSEPAELSEPESLSEPAELSEPVEDKD